MSDRDIREVLAQELLATAAWRRDEGSRVADGAQNTAAAEALERLAEQVRALPTDDRRLIELRRLNQDPEFFSMGGEEARQRVDRFGLGGDADLDCDGFLDGLVAAAREDEAARSRRLRAARRSDLRPGSHVEPSEGATANGRARAGEGR
jgi:hypothetical protein